MQHLLEPVGTDDAVNRQLSPRRRAGLIEWDAAAMKATNAPEAEALIRKTYRKGFELPG